MSETSTGPRLPGLACVYAAIYPILLPIARTHGYALAVHGSLARDFDLIAVPWAADCSDALTVIKALKAALGAITHHAEFDYHFPDCAPTAKPHGRFAYSLHLGNRGRNGPYLDISVMPCTSPNPTPNV